MEDSEKAYLDATRIKQDDKTAWQGLIALYEKQGANKLDAYHEAVLHLGHIFAERYECFSPQKYADGLTIYTMISGDRARCVDVVDKYINFTRKNGSRAQQKNSLFLQLPSSPLYYSLEGRVPHPSDTFLRLIDITESEEREYINREIGERRTRLGARIDLVTAEVKREALGRIELDNFYRGIIDWSNDDELRRKHEEKLLQRAFDLLMVLPKHQKPGKRKEVHKAAKDMVIIKHPFQLAWNIVLEWQDAESFSDWDANLFREFIEFFPDEGLSKVLRGFFASDLSPFSNEEESSDLNKESMNGDAIPEVAQQERLILMSDGLEQAPMSIISHRIMSQLYLNIGEFEIAIDTSRKGLIIAKDLAHRADVDLRRTSDSLNICLATALITYQSPRNHPEAKAIFEGILMRRPTETSCLLGIGLILEEDQDYSEAVSFLEKALDRDPANLRIQGELAWCKALTGNMTAGLEGLQSVLTVLQETKLSSREFKAQIYYRIGHCRWEMDPTAAARKDRNGAYASFLASIQSHVDYAPAYTSLGIFYADYKKDKIRARRCFHKAFELSAVETEAAERLARSFADQKEWDLVEAVVQRVIDSGRAKPAPGSKRKGYSWPFASLGVVQISRQQYAKSIVSFQAALRISPEEYHSWVGLGESYHNSGRYIAATKAFEHAETLEDKLTDNEKSDIWFARYMLANVKRELGEYEEAISRYENVLKIRPNEVGVSIALLQTLTESAWKSIDTGLFHEAAKLAAKAVLTAKDMVHDRFGLFNLWKAVADACSIFSYVKGKAGLAPLTDIRSLLATELDDQMIATMADWDELSREALDTLDGVDGDTARQANACIVATILACKRAIHVSVEDVHGQAVAWYNLGWAEFTAYRQLNFVSADKQPRKFLKAAIRCFKRAIELEAGNSEFWNSLGVVTTHLSPKVAQHAFVRSLYLNERSGQTWTNLGAFYLLHGDFQLSNEAFTRAQSADPDCSQAWLGQGFLALLFGDSEAGGLFAHAFDIAGSSATISKQQYAVTVFDHLLVDPSMSNDISLLIRPFFALLQLQNLEPSVTVFEHLSALLAERMGEYDYSKRSLAAVCATTELEFERTESSTALTRFAQANADMARCHLASQEYEAAAERAELTLNLTGEEDAAKFETERKQRIRLSAQLTAGLSYYYLKDMDQAIDMFRGALQESFNSPEVVCLLAQVLWAKGGDEERSVARERLFDCVEDNPEHVGAVTLLGAIAILDSDKDAIQAVYSDLQVMRTRDDIEIHDRAKVERLLTVISTLGLHEDSIVPCQTREITEAVSAVMLTPGQPQGWSELASTTDQLFPAEMAVKTALRNVPPQGTLDPTDLCHAYAQTNKISDSLRAIMVAPWKKDGWESLKQALPGST